METLNPHLLETIFNSKKETALFGKWIHDAHISPLLSKLSNKLAVTVIGNSENKVPIRSVQFGSGESKILIWTQMHGNESTGTKALFDFFNCIVSSKDPVFKAILEKCTILCIPMLNPDGSLNYTRANAKNIDLNRDAVDQKAIESKLLRSVLESFQPDYCFNLHDQRTIFGVEGTENPATISFLAPSEEVTRKLTEGRKLTMNVIVAMNTLLQQVIPNHVGRYTDEFYPTATGDNFQKLGFNTILIEAGHFPDDYDREEARKFNFYALVQGIHHIATAIDYKEYLPYFKIPNNQKNFFDIIELTKNTTKGKAYQFVDKVVDNKLVTEVVLEKEGDLKNYLGHKTIV
ncbi:M14 family zinc carboxypeptidase [Polaribacter uvawellassae]|uniref:M14 family zinc carboxypeptidase n=1 Tax=Polaribacter uvawellassae TaxID=3133495 RepID=UPI003219EB1A